MVVPPGGGPQTSYTRVTTISGSFDSGGGLAPWTAAHTVFGTLKHRGILGKWEALLSEHANPWYAGDKTKRECKELVKEAAKAGGSEDRRDLGTALHKIVAQINRGETPKIYSADTLRDMEAYCETLDNTYGIEVLPDLVETTVVLDDWLCGGTPDGYVRIPGEPKPWVYDLKTGADLTYSFPGYRMQMAAYAKANNIYRQGRAPDGSEDQRLPPVDVNQETGLIVWLPAGEGRCVLFAVDLVDGWEGFKIAAAAYEWQRNKAGVTPYSQWTPRPAAVMADVIDLATAGDRRNPFPDGVGSYNVAKTRTSMEDEYRAKLERQRDWLQRRIIRLGEHPGPRTALEQAWPITTSLRNADLSADLVATVRRIVDEIETRYGIPFGETEPDVLTPTRNLFPTSKDQTT